MLHSLPVSCFKLPYYPGGWLRALLLSFLLLLIRHDRAPGALRHHQRYLQHPVHAHSSNANSAQRWSQHSRCQMDLLCCARLCT